jgi:hypothetical protein
MKIHVPKPAALDLAKALSLPAGLKGRDEGWDERRESGVCGLLQVD